MSEEPYFEPWSGEHYRSGVEGVRLLLVGDSHYAADAEDGNSELTRNVVRRVVGGEYMRFFANTQLVISGSTNGTEVALWDSIAFYNYVQELAGATHEAIPTTSMYRKAASPFERVLHRLKPDGVLVLCKRTWLKIGTDFPHGTNSTPMGGDDDIRHWAYPSGLAMVSTWINHPSGSHGFKPADWYDRVRRFLSIARVP